jgi:hypothetical protein
MDRIAGGRTLSHMQGVFEVLNLERLWQDDGVNRTEASQKSRHADRRDQKSPADAGVEDQEALGIKRAGVVDVKLRLCGSEPLRAWGRRKPAPLEVPGKEAASLARPYHEGAKVWCGRWTRDWIDEDCSRREVGDCASLFKFSVDNLFSPTRT